MSSSYSSLSAYTSGQSGDEQSEVSSSSNSSSSHSPSSSPPSEFSLDKKGAGHYGEEARNLIFLFLLPMAFIVIVNAIPLSDPNVKHDSLGEMVVQQWVYFFIYAPFCYTIGSVIFARWIVDLCQIEFSYYDYAACWCAFVPTSVMTYIFLGFLWTFPIPVGSLFATMPGLMCFLGVSFYIGRKKMIDRGFGDEIFWRLPVSQLCGSLTIMEVVISLIAFNLMKHYKDSPNATVLQIAVTIGYSVAVTMCLAVAEKSVSKLVNPAKASTLDFVHYTLTIWYKAFVMSEVSNFSVLAITIVLDAFTISKDVWSFHVSYDRTLTWMATCGRGQAAASTSSSASSSSEYSEGEGRTRVTMSRGAMLDLFNKLDADGSGRLDLGEMRKLAHAIGTTVEELLKYDADGNGALDKNEFLRFMRDGVSDFKIDKYAARQWAAVTAPIYYACGLAIVAYGPNNDFYYTSLTCDPEWGTAKCEHEKWNVFKLSLIYGVIVFVSRVLFNTVAAFYLKWSVDINILKSGLAKIAANVGLHFWEACFATLIMVKFILLHSNSDMFNLNVAAAKWSPFYK